MPSVGKDVEELDLLYIAGVKAKEYSHFEKFWQFV